MSLYNISIFWFHNATNFTRLKCRLLSKAKTKEQTIIARNNDNCTITKRFAKISPPTQKHLQFISLPFPTGYSHARRVNTARQINPIPYRADYFGHKLHVDQNEKLVMFGVTHICGIDGYSGKIVGFATMPIKNCVEIYSQFFV